MLTHAAGGEQLSAEPPLWLFIKSLMQCHCFALSRRRSAGTINFTDKLSQAFGAQHIVNSNIPCI